MRRADAIVFGIPSNQSAADSIPGLTASAEMTVRPEKVPSAVPPRGRFAHDFPATMEEASYFWRLERHMEQIPGLGTMGSRRNEDIALDMMKFIASTTGYGRTTGGAAAGFQTGTESKSEDYATHLLDLYTRCLNTVNGKK